MSKSSWLVLGSGTILVFALWLLQVFVRGEGLVLGNLTKQGALELIVPERAIIQEPFTVEILVDTGNQRVNAVGIYVTFDPARLQLLQLDSQQSFCQFYPEKKFDNQLGTVSLACGSPHPGVSGVNQAMVLQFLPTALGETVIRLSPESKILLSDGTGTNILTDVPQAKVSVINGL